ncbi:MAG: histone deacetylase, partial [Armatimonadota bacterium]|nr:histone deacetylase [Armatimonadota bacterium]
MNVRAFILAGTALLSLGSGKAEPQPSTGLVTSETYLQHDTGVGHPEKPERLRAIIRRLEEGGTLKRLKQLEPRRAETRWLTTVHTLDYVREVERACREGKPYLHSPDTPISTGSFAAALLAAGGVLRAIDAVMAGAVRNAFCAVRPPGHHALRSRAMGFCLFNNVAVGAHYVRQHHRVRRVLIVDWDVHHGNGTQAAFESDPDVLY